jgi:hypothetical protein
MAYEQAIHHYAALAVRYDRQVPQLIALGQLWTTQKHTLEPYEFDGFRVFIFNTKRHRYETAYMDKQVKGFYPVEAKQGATPSFSLILENDDGKRYKYNFAFDVNRVRFVERLHPRPARK